MDQATPSPSRRQTSQADGISLARRQSSHGEGNSLPRRHSSLGGEASATNYSRFITSCFSRQPDAAPYYKQLLDYIAPGSRQYGYSNLQQPRYYELKKKTISSGSHALYSEIPSGIVRRYPCIAVLEGFPSPECISAIGANDLVRPELFIGHMNFSRSSSLSQRFFELPSLPSDRSNIVHVRLVTLGQTATAATKLTSQAQSRLVAEQRCLDFERQLFRERQYGSTRFRKVHLHSPQIFSVEQMVSFTVTQREGMPWTGTFLLDRGRDLKGRHNLPWSDYRVGERRNPDIIPIIPYNDCILNYSKGSSFPVAEPANLHPYNPLNDLYMNEESDMELLSQDPFFLLSRLFSVAARSWSLLLNYLEEEIQLCSAMDDEEQLSPALEQLRFNSSLMTRILGFLKEDQHVIEARGVSSWPKTSDPKLEQRLLSIQASLRENYEFLISRCDQLSARCEVGSGILVTAAQLLEAHKGIDQAKQVHNLTKLAFIFIPLTFVASIFGMNVSTFKEFPPLWLYFLIALPLTILSWFGAAGFGREGRNLLQFIKRRISRSR